MKNPTLLSNRNLIQVYKTMCIIYNVVKIPYVRNYIKACQIVAGFKQINLEGK